MTSIEWLIKEVESYGTGKFRDLFKETIEQAKKMHKQEIIDAANLAKDNWFDVINYNSLGEQYYKETFEYANR
jgi:hypothetical protein